LSCSLPKLTSQAANIRTQLILPGNWFDWEPPAWVDYRDSSLCVDQADQRWDLWVLSSSLSALIIAAPVLLAARRHFPVVVTPLWQEEQRYLTFVSSRLLKCLVLPSCLAIALAAAYQLGSGHFQCGPAVAKVTLSAIVFPAPVDWVVLVMVSIWLPSAALATANCAKSCSRSPMRGEPQVPRRSGAWCSRIIWKVAWVLGLLMMSLPTVVFVASDWLPDDNYFNLESDSVDRVQWTGSQVLALVSNFGVPWWTKVCWRSGISKTVSQMLGRILIIWLVPLCASVSMADGCYRGWARWWNPCLRLGTFDTDVRVLDNLVQVLSQEGVCGSPPEWGRCARDVIGNLSVLYTRKMFLSAFQIPFLRLATDIYRRKMGWDVQHSFEEAVGSLVAAVDFVLVFGLAFPLLVPLCAATVLTTTVCQRLSVHMCGAEVYMACDFDSVKREVSLYFVFSHVLQCIMIPLAFFEMGVLGSKIWPLFIVAGVSLAMILVVLLWPHGDVDDESEMQSSSPGLVELVPFK